MKYEITIAARYLWMARKRAHTAFLTLISTLGLAVGVATLLISLALLSGLQGKIKSRLIAGSPQILVEPSGGSSIPNADEVVKEIRRIAPGRVERVVSAIVWASTPSGSQGRPMQLRSFDERSEPAADTAFGRNWSVESSSPIDSIYLRRDFASSVGLFLSDEIVLVSPRTRLTPFGPVPVWRRYRIARIIPLTDNERDPEGWLAFEDAATLLGTGGAPTSIQVFTDLAAADRVMARLNQTFPSLLVRSWREMNRPLFLALRLEKIVMFATISLVIFVAALNLISSISMMIVEKRPQVGVLRTLGASERSILVIFVSVGLLIGLIGTVLGNLVGLGVAWAADRYELVSLPGDVSFVRYIPFTIEAADVIGVNLIAILLTILATWYPAVTASRLDPVSAIRE